MFQKVLSTCKYKKNCKLYFKSTSLSRLVRIKIKRIKKGGREDYDEKINLEREISEKFCSTREGE